MGEVISFRPRLRALPLNTAEQFAVKDALNQPDECKDCYGTGWLVWRKNAEYFRERCDCGAADCFDEPDFDGAA